MPDPHWGRPRWRADQPLLWRRDGAVQLGLPWSEGLGPPPVIGIGIDRAGAGWLQTLDGADTLAAAEHRSGLPAAEVRRLLRFAASGGALDDAAMGFDVARWLPPEGRLRLEAQAASARLASLSPAGVDARVRPRIRVEGWTPLADPLHRHLERSGLTLTDGDADLVVQAACGHPEVLRDPTSVAAEALLPVLAFGPWAGAGPLSVPGLTSCRLCRHLHRCDADPEWGMLALQWSAAVAHLPAPPIDELLIDLIAVHAALLVRAWALDPADPAQWGDIALVASLHEGGVLCVPRPPHPLCGCRWDPRLGAGEESG